MSGAVDCALFRTSSKTSGVLQLLYFYCVSTGRHLLAVLMLALRCMDNFCEAAHITFERVCYTHSSKLLATVAWHIELGMDKLKTEF